MVFSHKSAEVEILVFFKKVQSRWRKWSKIEVEKTVFFYQVEKMGSPGMDMWYMAVTFQILTLTHFYLLRYKIF